jgi:hypothetical protein
MTDAVSFDQIDGTPIKYGSPGNYQRLTVGANNGFYNNKLTSWIRSLRWFSKNYGNADFQSLSWLGHAGAYVCKNGCHGRGRAFDLNFVRWNDYDLNIFSGVHADSRQGKRRRYLAVDGCCRRYFKYTLDGWYNTAHNNHIHIDNHTTPILNRNSRSDTVFVQAVCVNFNNSPMSIDGVWGSRTEEGFDNLNTNWGYDFCNPFSSHDDYAEWCAQVMRHGFANAPAGTYLSSC